MCRPNDEHQFRALKVLSAECYGQGHPIFEREILTHLRAGNRKLLGYKHVCHLVDDFELEGPNGNHVFLVLELMGENLRTFVVWFQEDMLPTALMRRFTYQLVGALDALDFAHESNVIHTGMLLPWETMIWAFKTQRILDIKPDNIFVKLRDAQRIASVYLVEEPIPKQDKTEERYTPIQARPLRAHYFETDLTQFNELDIALGDWGGVELGKQAPD